MYVLLFLVHCQHSWTDNFSGLLRQRIIAKGIFRPSQICSYTHIHAHIQRKKERKKEKKKERREKKAKRTSNLKKGKKAENQNRPLEMGGTSPPPPKRPLPVWFLISIGICLETKLKVTFCLVIAAAVTENKMMMTRTVIMIIKKRKRRYIRKEKNGSEKLTIRRKR